MPVVPVVGQQIIDGDSIGKAEVLTAYTYTVAVAGGLLNRVITV